MIATAPPPPPSREFKPEEDDFVQELKVKEDEAAQRTETLLRTRGWTVSMLHDRYVVRDSDQAEESHAPLE